MDIKLVPVTFKEKESFINLYQFYLYDFSLYTDHEVNKEVDLLVIVKEKLAKDTYKESRLFRSRRKQVNGL